MFWPPPVDALAPGWSSVLVGTKSIPLCFSCGRVREDPKKKLSPSYMTPPQWQSPIEDLARQSKALPFSSKMSAKPYPLPDGTAGDPRGVDKLHVGPPDARIVNG